MNNPIVVPMTVQSNNVFLPLGVSNTNQFVGMDCEFVIVSGLNAHYEGSYEFTPGDTEQIIAIADKTATADIIIKPIPSNYGLITYNGVGIRVS